MGASSACNRSSFIRQKLDLQQKINDFYDALKWFLPEREPCCPPWFSRFWPSTKVVWIDNDTVVLLWVVTIGIECVCYSAAIHGRISRCFDLSYFGALLLAGIVLVSLTSCTNSPSLTSITVSPTTMNFGGAGLTTQLTAIGSYTSGTHPAQTKDITSQVTWASATPQCVTVSSTGLITSGGNTCSGILIRASAPGFNGDISGSMTVNVTQTSGGGGGTNSDVASIITLGSRMAAEPSPAPSQQTATQYTAIGTNREAVIRQGPKTVEWR